MKRKLFIGGLIIVTVILAALVLSGCKDMGTLPEGYIEVESLRIEDATVYLSPSGDTSQYQLNVETVPSNATNRKLSYYIPGKYLDYVTVDSKGLIKAKLQPEEDIRIPLTVTSTSNKNASLVVGLIVEYAEVKEIEFNENNLEMLYKGDPVQLGVKYTPYHAQDGRNITYTSLNTEVATVSASGLLTPVAVGHVTIVALGKTISGKEIQAQFHAVIKYAKSRYRLEVSDSSPKFKQVLGSPQPISFTLLSLEPQSDPNPRIQWYVGGVPDKTNDGRSDYGHVPVASTPLNYKIEVRVKCYEEPEQSLYSDTIYIYNKFSGFNFLVENESAAYSDYLYGDEATFSINASGYEVDHFVWTLKRVGQKTKGIKVALTPGTSPDLTRKLNLDGDYNLVAAGADASGNALYGKEYTFNFNVTRYVAGDTIIVTPQVLSGGMPPESYNFSLQSYRDGFLISETTLNSTMSNVLIKGNTLYYTMRPTDGDIAITAKGMLEGKVATVTEDDQEKEFAFATPVIRVYGSDFSQTAAHNDIIDGTALSLDYAARGESTITDLIIDGMYEKVSGIDRYTPLIYWSAVGGTGTYWVEITKADGSIKLYNSTEGANFGDYYCKLNDGFVTLKDRFKVRVKQKGGEYTPYHYYGYAAPANSDLRQYFDIIAENRYTYLKAFSTLTNNGYVRSLKELGEILDYIFLYDPPANSNSLISVNSRVTLAIDGQLETFDRSYGIKLYLEPEFAYYASYYPITVSTNKMEEIYLNPYKSLIAVQNAYCETSDALVEMLFDQTDGGLWIKLYKNLSTPSGGMVKTEPAEPRGGVSENYSSAPYGATYGDYAINYKTGSAVNTSDQLYNIAQAGLRPIPQTDITNSVYNAAKAIINEIIGEGMTDAQKVLAFYDWLVLNVEYDHDALAQINAVGFSGTAYDYEAFHLEGALLSRKAVCDGIAKAFSLLCWIEDIPCYKVSGYAGTGHAWNKAYIDGAWYVIDATWAITTSGADYINYAYFLNTDARFIDNHTMFGTLPLIYGEYEKAVSGNDYYTRTLIMGMDLYVDSIAELAALLNVYGDDIDGEMIFQVKLGANLMAEYDRGLSEYTLAAIADAVRPLVTGNKYMVSNSEIEGLDRDIMAIRIRPIGG